MVHRNLVKAHNQKPSHNSILLSFLLQSDLTNLIKCFLTSWEQWFNHQLACHLSQRFPTLANSFPQHEAHSRPLPQVLLSSWNSFPQLPLPCSMHIIIPSLSLSSKHGQTKEIPAAMLDSFSSSNAFKFKEKRQAMLPFLIVNAICLLILCTLPILNELVRTFFSCTVR